MSTAQTRTQAGAGEDLAALVAGADAEEEALPAAGHARLVRGTGRSADWPELTAEQEAVASLAPGHGAVLVLGTPGAGRSTVAVEYAARRLSSGMDPEALLMLAPTREAAARLRDDLTARLAAAGRGTRAVTPVRTWASYAFDVLRRARVDGPLGHLTDPPRLLSGAEQDTVITELLEAYADGLAPSPAWPEEVAAAVGARGFRREVRELVDRMSEFGLEPGDLQALGRRYGRPEWTAAAELVQDYRDRMDLGDAEAFDPAGLIAAAVRVLTERHPEDPERDAAARAFAAGERARLQVLVVEDLHEATPAVHDLLAVLGTGTDVLLTACPDSTVEGFRGARPDLISRYPAALDVPSPPPGLAAPQERIHVLTQGHRMGQAVQEGWLRVARRVRQRTLGVERTRAEAVPAAEGGRVEAHVVPSRSHEDQLVLERVLRIHHEDAVPLDEILVVARSGARVAALARHLEAEGVPVLQDAAGSVLKDEPAVAPLLTLLRAVAEEAEQHPEGAVTVRLDADEVVALLRGRYGPATALHVRRLRQDLLAAERTRGGRRPSDELIVAALADPALAGVEADRHRALRRLSWMHAAGLEAARTPGATAETVLWALWSASGRAERWRDLALAPVTDAAGRREARRADADLDAVVALFRIAERHAEQFPGASPAEFARYMESQDLPMDSLARRAETGDAVHVRTPASAVAAGRGWHAVLLVGLQEGAWPNTQLRGRLLGAPDLADLLTAPPGAPWPVDRRTRLQEVRQDELRMLAAAISRARTHVVATAVRSEDDAPSDFLDLIQPPEDPRRLRPLTPVPPPLTAAALVAGLRRRLEAPDLPEAIVGVEDPAAAAGLAALAADGVDAADPAHWWGLAPLSTQAPLTDPTTTAVRLSPSRAETALTNPLDWLLQHVGAQGGASLAQSVGTLVHSVAEHHPDGEPGAVRAELERRLPELGLPEGWGTDLEHARARRLVEAYIGYWSVMREAGRRPLAQEVPLRADLTWEGLHVVVNGVIDRLEVDAVGHPYVVDLKTGRRTPGSDELPRLPQLAAYQVAVRAGGLTGLLEDPETDPVLREALTALADPAAPAGAALVQLGAGTQRTKVQEQAALTDEDRWAREQVFTAARRTVGPRYLTIHAPGGRCALPSVCPLCSEGRQATEWNR
ncbi:PD-(D/E)XK nuclease family protein [Micrococcus sp.]|uniref:PD-(D/E)XK nuclease family protein n=1 Tax=Micrococcus sp. TaxID=1271 RepID=UPI002A91DE45|nr:PD-(D/E)XK nuclease family protein [Micrococcus sp.]MDY6055145.1 PD-(D/E)XK nuclease family protein [Micrococcus sp.]